MDTNHFVKMKRYIIEFYRFPAALILFAGFAILLIFRDRVLRLPVEPFAEHTRVILNNNIPVFSAVIWVLVLIRLLLKFVVIPMLQ